VEAAIEAAMSGKTCALISSGDPGIYAMAGLVFETCKIKKIPVLPLRGPQDDSAATRRWQWKSCPASPALCAGAALLGAPLTHDFAVVSLSDLLTPWEVIAERLEAAARADFVIVLLQPEEQKTGLAAVQSAEILLSHRDPATPVGVVVGPCARTRMCRSLRSATCISPRWTCRPLFRRQPFLGPLPGIHVYAPRIYG